MNKITENLQIIETNDYDLFELSLFQRPLRDYTQLKASILENGFKKEFPIIVRVTNTNKFEIIAGHHRFVAAKEANVPIKYIVTTDTIEQIMVLESLNKAWVLSDYLSSYIKQDFKEYIKIKQYQEQTGIPLSLVLYILSDGTEKEKEITKIFKNGKFIIKNIAIGKQMHEAILELKKNNMPFWNKVKFLKGLFLCCKCDFFDLKFFIKKVVHSPHLLKKIPSTISENVQMIENIYNLKLKNKKPISLVFNINKNIKKIF